MQDLTFRIAEGVEALIVLAQVLAATRHLREEKSIDVLLKWSVQQDIRIDQLERALKECQSK